VREPSMPRALSRTEVRDVDRRAMDEYGLPGVVLMENAGRSAAEWLVAKLGAQDTVAIVCGKGNNAGDGFVIARHLELRGCKPVVFLAAPPESLSGDAALFFQVVRNSDIPWPDLSPAPRDEWSAAMAAVEPTYIVDALLGTGLTGPARAPFASVIDAINILKLPVFAVDLPSGLDCDTGFPLGPCIRAAHTGTFVARKIGFDNPSSKEWTGEVHVLDIGVPAALLRDVFQSPRPRRGGEGY
jgi:NAD(P)H-hydrate epimerase